MFVCVQNLKNLEDSEKQLAQRDREKSAVEKALRTKDDELMGKIREADTAAKALVSGRRSALFYCCLPPAARLLVPGFRGS